MIYPALNLLISQLNTYLAQEVEEPNAAVLGNVAMQDAGVTGKLVLTLVNIEEEKALKNSGPYHTYYINLTTLHFILHLIVMIC